MTFLAPIFFYIGLAVAAGAVALHFIVTRQPASSPLPTVRFVPTSAVRVTTLAPVPEDLLVLLVRVLIALLLGAAFARPILVPERRPVARIVLADAGRGIANIGEVRDSVRTLLGERDVLVVFDTAARTVRASVAVDTLVHLTRADAESRLSPALVAALRAASRLREEADSVELAIISPLRASAVDGATQAIRALWPGRIRLVAVTPAADTVAPRAGAAVRAPSGDGVALALAAVGIPAVDSAVRIVRGIATQADSAWVAGGARTLVRWPATGAPPHWSARAAPDTAGAVLAGSAALVHPLERRWQLDAGAAHTSVAARWVDGAPAAVEYTAGAGCIRDVAIPVPERGDFVLRPAFGQLVRALAAPCTRVAGGRALADGDRQLLAGTGPMAASARIAAPEVVATPLVPWLIGLALLLVLLELVVRRTRRNAWDRVASGTAPGRAEEAAA